MFPLCCHYLCSVLCLSTHLSSRFRHVMPYPCVCPALLIVCPALIVFTCLSSPCVYSLCVPVFLLPVRLSFSMFLAFQRLPVLIDLVLPTTACITDCVSAFPLLDTLPDHRLPACVPTLDRTYYELCRCPFLIGFVYLFMDCLSVYRTQSVKFVYCTYLCLRFMRLDPQSLLHSLQRSSISTRTSAKKELRKSGRTEK